MHISEILNPNNLADEINNGYITARSINGITIYNYTDKAQWDRRWNNETSQCRGIITDEAGTVLARPFPKFFNHNEPEAHTPNEPVIVTDKADGSLGIAYTINGVVRIATRGSLISEQAIHATRLLADKHPSWRPPAGVTALFEIIYPENRIVLDYGDTDDLVLLGGIHIGSGWHITTSELGWDGPTIEQLPYASLQEALAAPPRKNAEGMVVHFLEANTRVKIKQEDYVRLHRIVTGWNERTIWEHLQAGETLAQLIDGLPDEFHRWAVETAKQIIEAKELGEERARFAFYEILADMPAGWERKDFAQAAVKQPDLRPALFQLLDNKPIDIWAWKRVRPSTQKEATIA